MTTGKWTKEPWQREYPGFNDIRLTAPQYDATIAVCGRWAAEFESEQLANFDRIVACVNACAGISTEALEGGLLLNVLDENKYDVTMEE